jgi:hypothetical protein
LSTRVPANWFKKAKLSPDRQRASLNYFGVNASQSLEVWRQKGWIYPEDPRDGFNGTAVIIRDDAVRMTYARSAGGVRFGVMRRN